jgi:hypothetical protein
VGELKDGCAPAAGTPPPGTPARTAPASAREEATTDNMAANNSGVVLYTAFHPSSVQFGAPDRNRNGGKFVPLAGPDGAKRRITIQTPVLAMPFGVSAFREKPDAEVQSYSIDVSFRNLEADPKLSEFLAKMRELDARMIEASVANSKEWFGGKQKSKETLEDNYRKLIKDHPEGKYPPVMKIKVPIQNGQPACMFFGEDRQPVGIDYLTKGTTIKLILEMDRVWFVNNTFGVTWRALQGAVVSRPSRMDKYSMLDDDETDEALLGLDIAATVENGMELS